MSDERPGETPEEWKARIGVGQPSNVVQRVGGQGTSRTRLVPSDMGPGPAGHVTERWDGSNDATAYAPHVTVKGRPHL